MELKEWCFQLTVCIFFEKIALWPGRVCFKAQQGLLQLFVRLALTIMDGFGISHQVFLVQ